MRSLFLAIALTTIVACNNASVSADPSVTIAGELLLGEYVENRTVAAFLGVPFAEPPVGELRWRAPQPLRTKLERRDATEFAPACMQTMRILDWYRYMAESFGGSADFYDDLEISEDCLYLNIWTPRLDTEAKLPVMVWVHGGSNRSGWSYEPNYHGHRLAQEAVVVVTVAYRQGAFGFLSHPDLDTDEPASNFGLWDIVASLQWIQDHIEQFGGDPNRVTAFGESAGAQDILALMFAEPARDLFHRAILESTGGFGVDRVATLAAEKKRGEDLGRLLGFEEGGTLQQLRQVPADEILAVYEDAFADYYHSPALDGRLLTDSLWANIHAGRFGDQQLIIGTNASEWLDYIAADATGEDVVSAADDLSQLDRSAALAAVASETDPRRAMDRITTAKNFLCPSQATAASMTAAGQSAWMYYFTRVREGKAGEKLGAYHGAELPYVFGTHDAYMPTTDIDQTLTETLIRYWTQFAAAGNPNSERTPDWPQFNAPDYPVQELGDEVLAIPAPEPELCAIFDARNTRQD
ncbi:MAG: carboxylesterase family protein [Gammaproteobacteria bacterium]|nr:carboxylesterase family protein [Gammaproteobacteria bacterium]